MNKKAPVMRRFFLYGLRNRAGKALAGFVFLGGAAMAGEPVEIVALGDSLTQGYGLAEEDGLVPQLRRWLDENGYEASVINAGVSGDTTAGGLARAEWSLTPETDAMILALGANDMLRGVDPASSRANLDGILKIAEGRGLAVLLIGVKTPGNFGPEYKAQFDAIYHDLSAQYQTLFIEDFFAALREDGAAPADWRAFMQADGIHPNADGVRRIVEVIGPEAAALIARAGE